MPTFPSPSLKFRTAGFPQYGFKVGMSNGTFLRMVEVKPAPGIPSSIVSLSPSFAGVRGRGKPGSESRSVCSFTGHHSRSIYSSTPGVLGSGASFVVSLHLRFYDPMRQSHRHAAISWHSPYTQRLRCAGAPKRPMEPSLLSLLLFPYVPSTLLRRSTNPLSRLSSRWFQTSSILERVVTHNIRLCQQFPTGFFISELHRFALCYGPYVCLALLTGYDKMKSRVLHLAL